MCYIKKYKVFESIVKEFTREMAQEIIYYFSDGSDPIDSINKKFGTFNKKYNQIFDDSFYDVGYKEMNVLIDDLVKISKREDIARDMLIEIYSDIREERKDFPEVSKIEDAFLDLIEHEKFEFSISSDDTGYILKLRKSISSKNNIIENYIMYIKSVLNSIKKISGNNYNTILTNSEMSQNYRDNDDSVRNDFYCFYQFEISLFK